jgi:hypothetical protein
VRRLLLGSRRRSRRSDGSKRRFGAGDCFLADDLSGQGHKTVDVEGPVRLLYVQLPADIDATRWRA